MSAVLIASRAGVRVRVRKADRASSTGTVDDGHMVGTIELYIDTDKLIEALGPKALKSRRKRSELIGGAVCARAVQISHQAGG
jgi:hypothetical protein